MLLSVKKKIYFSFRRQLFFNIFVTQILSTIKKKEQKYKMSKKKKITNESK